MVTHSRHSYHSLYFRKFLIEEDEVEFYCDVCEEPRDPNLPVYYCEECKYIAHVSCVVPQILPSEEAEWSFFIRILSLCTDEKYKILPSPFPEGEWSPLLEGLCYNDKTNKRIADISMISRKEYKGEEVEEKPEGSIKHEKRRFMHFTHPHPLILVTEKEADKISKTGCYMCDRYIPNAITYGCTKCNVFLQEPCLNLPQKIQHYLHSQHPLSFAKHNTKCKICSTEDRIVYTCNKCDTWIGANCCAPLEPAIQYKEHEHTLTITSNFSSHKSNCNSCHKSIEDDTLTLICKDCSFVAHYNCGGGPKLPLTAVHKRHSYHPLYFTKFLVEEEEEEFYCDICEEPRDQNLPVYYCEPCKYVAHISCVIPEIALEGEWSFFYHVIKEDSDGSYGILPSLGEGNWSPYFHGLSIDLSNGSKEELQSHVFNFIKGIADMTIKKEYKGLDEDNKQLYRRR